MSNLTDACITYFFGIYNTVYPFENFIFETICKLACTCKNFKTYVSHIPTCHEIDKMIYLPGEPYEKPDCHLANIWNVYEYTSRIANGVGRYVGYLRRNLYLLEGYKINSVLRVITHSWKIDLVQWSTMFNLAGGGQSYMNECVYSFYRGSIWRDLENSGLVILRCSHLSNDFVKDMLMHVLLFRNYASLIDKVKKDIQTDLGIEMVHYNKKIRQIIRGGIKREGFEYNLQKEWINSEILSKKLAFNEKSEELRIIKFVHNFKNKIERTK